MGCPAPDGPPAAPGDPWRGVAKSAARRWREFLRLAVVFVLFTALYEFGRYVVATESSAAPVHHAQRVIAFEKGVGLFFEPRLQGLVMPHPALSETMAWAYTYAHHAGAVVFLAWLWAAMPRQFPFVWRWFWLSHAVAVLGFWLFPVAPPRLVPELGLADPAAAELAAVPGAGAFAHVRNEFAAMPSLHVGYPLLFATVLWFVLPRSGLRWAAWLWPVAIAFVVMATANHYWADAVGGAIAVGAALVVAALVWRNLPRPWSRAAPPAV